MTKIGSIPVSLTDLPASSRDDGPDRRLIVLIPADIDSTAAVRQVWELANAFESRVQFLGLCKDAAQEASLRRQLITMSAMMQDAKVQAEAWVVVGKDWVSAVKPYLKDGDTLVCFSEQRAGTFQRPLSQILESNLPAPVYVLSGYSPQSSARLGWLSQIAVWTGSLGIIAGCTLLQMRMVSLPRDWALTTFMILSVIAEAWLIWVWNGLFG